MKKTLPRSKNALAALAILATAMLSGCHKGTVPNPATDSTSTAAKTTVQLLTVGPWKFKALYSVPSELNLKYGIRDYKNSPYWEPTLGLGIDSSEVLTYTADGKWNTKFSDGTGVTGTWVMQNGLLVEYQPAFSLSIPASTGDIVVTDSNLTVYWLNVTPDSLCAYGKEEFTH